MSMDAVLPAGGRLRGRLARELGVGPKALLAPGGRTLLEQAISALRATGRVGRIAVVGPPEVIAHPAAGAADAALPEGGPSGPANIFRGLEWLAAGGQPPGARVLVVTTDLPFLTREGIIGLMEACPEEVDICVPVVRREEFARRFPGHSPVSVRLRDGRWLIGGAFVVSPSALLANRGLIERAFAARKMPLLMARLLGPGFILRYLARRLGVSDIERRCLGLLGCRGGAVRGCAPELAFDIDRPADYRYAVEHLRRAKGGLHEDA